MDILNYHNEGLKKFRADPVLSTSRSFYYTFQERDSKNSNINAGFTDTFEFAYNEVKVAAERSFSKVFNGGVEYIISKISDSVGDVSHVRFFDGEVFFRAKK